MRKVLGEDLERIASSHSDASSSKGNSMIITLLPDDAESITINVQSNQIVQNIIKEALKCSAAQIRSMVVSLGGETVEMTMCFEENGIEDGARLEVSLRREATLKEVIQDMLELNPHLIDDGGIRTLTVGVTFENDDGIRIKDWNLSGRDLVALPESFGSIAMSGDLCLAKNKLASLPESFGSITVRGNLRLDYNKLASLPESFWSITVGGYLNFFHNKLASLPESFGSITVGGDLDLSDNRLVSLPESFGSITVGGTLDLSSNKLVSLPESFGSITVGGDLSLLHNKLVSLPEGGFPTVGGKVSLKNANRYGYRKSP